MDLLAAGATALVLAHATYTDVRWRVIRNWTVAGGAGVGLALGATTHGVSGLLAGLEGLVLGAAWWVAVRHLHLGAGDAKLAMAVGALLGPAIALAGPALGYMLCALALLPWIGWRQARRLPWRNAALPMAPWIAAGTALIALSGLG